MSAGLTYHSVIVRPVLVPLHRKVISRVGCFDEWPLILIDVRTNEGIVGVSYLEPYLAQSIRYIVPAIQIFSPCAWENRCARWTISLPGGSR